LIAFGSSKCSVAAAESYFWRSKARVKRLDKQLFFPFGSGRNIIWR